MNYNSNFRSYNRSTTGGRFNMGKSASRKSAASARSGANAFGYGAYRFQHEMFRQACQEEQYIKDRLRFGEKLQKDIIRNKEKEQRQREREEKARRKAEQAAQRKAEKELQAIQSLDRKVRTKFTTGKSNIVAQIRNLVDNVEALTKRKDIDDDLKYHAINFLKDVEEAFDYFIADYNQFYNEKFIAVFNDNREIIEETMGERASVYGVIDDADLELIATNTWAAIVDGRIKTKSQIERFIDEQYNRVVSFNRQ